MISLMSFADELEGSYTTPSRVTNQLELKIYKSDSDGNYHIRAKKKNERGYTTYSTNTSSFEEGSNYLFGEMVMQGLASTLGKKCRVIFYCTNGSVKSLEAYIDGIQYNLMKIPDLRKRAERQTNNNSSSTSSTDRQHAYDAQTWIDLGLPSGTMWKSHNESGYFTEKEAYNSYGANIPTKKQFEELITVCDWTWYGYGYKIIGPNGNFIKLPAGGWKDLQGNTVDEGYNGTYWTRNYDDNERFWVLQFFPSHPGTASKYWKFGHPVRLVQNP